MPLWLTDVTTVEHVRPPNLPMRAIGMMQEAFFVQTARLSDQGKVLVPGLTLGVLGQDYVPAEGDGTDIDSTYAAQVEDAFQRSGIVHLMAVSGGHLAVTAALVRSVCSFFGRRGQAMASLSWTTLAMLMTCPHMSQSFGFALSCAAVLGIVLFADTLNAWMEPVLPRFVAEALSMTIAAQVFTLPIQVLIEPELPVFSIPANLMVAPFVGFATLAGLASLAVSWLIPWLGLQLARAASWGTAVMELTALELGSGSQATIPWAGGVGGAVLVCVVEAACAAAAIMTHRLFGRMMVQEPDLPGKRLIANPVERLRMWMERTRKALRELQWEE